MDLSQAELERQERLAQRERDLGPYQAADEPPGSMDQELERVRAANAANTRVLALKRKLRELRRVGTRHGIAEARDELARVRREGYSSAPLVIRDAGPDEVDIIETTLKDGRENPTRRHRVLTGGDNLHASDVLMHGIGALVKTRRLHVVSSRMRSQTRRRREVVKGASRRASARSGDSPDDEPGEPEPDGERVERLCKNCGGDISHRRRDAGTCDSKCRSEWHRKQAKAAETIKQRCVSCGCFLSRYGGGGAQCWTCAFAKTSDPRDPALGEVIAHLCNSDPLAELLRSCGGWPGPSKRSRRRVVGVRSALGIALPEWQQAEAWLDFGGGPDQGELLAVAA